MAITLELAPEIEARLIAQAAAQGMSTEAFLQAVIENLLNAEPQVYQIGSALAVHSTPIGNLENSVDQTQEEQDKKHSLADALIQLRQICSEENYTLQIPERQDRSNPLRESP